MKVRLDGLIVERGLAKDIKEAHALLLSGRIRAPGLGKVKAGELVSPDQPLERVEENPFVSRGGLKLQAALKEFRIDVRGRACVDLGASTGGFTDCLLQAGASRVMAVDVGHGQLDWALRNDARVLNREKTHVLKVTRDEVNTFFSRGGGASLPQTGFVAVDVSFISLEKVFPHLAEIFPKGTELVVLVKPQFEVGPKEAPKGVVRDPSVHAQVLAKIEHGANASGFVLLGKRESPITGPEGNHEFLFWLRRT